MARAAGPPATAGGVAWELTVTGVAAGGDGIARRDDGMVVLVTGALPGERVLARPVAERRDWARAEVVAVRVAAPERRTAPCVHRREGCGGCPLDHVTPVGQRRLRERIVVDALRRIGGVGDPRVASAPPLPPGGRTTLRLARGPTGWGMRAARSHRVVAVRTCAVAHPALAGLVEALSPDAPATAAVLRCGARTGDRLVVGEPTAEGLLRDPRWPAVGLDELRAGRRAWIHEIVAGHRFRISARSFFQARPDGAEQLVAAVETAAGGAGDDGVLLDAYAGVGLFGALVGRPRRVVAVETSADAVADARRNLSHRRATVIRCPVERWRPRRADLVIADPARRGLGRRAVEVLTATGAPVLILVSCDPAALGRDAALLAAHGWRFEGSRLVDMFEGTAHTEVVSRFARPGAPPAPDGWPAGP